MGNHLYEENKKLVRENEDLRRQLQERAVAKDTDVVLDAIVGFCQGTARIRVERNGDDYAISFQH